MLFGFSAFAAEEQTQSFTYEGQLLEQDGVSPVRESVSFKFQILNPAGNCILYEESQSDINLSTTDGQFALSLGSKVGSSKRGSGTALILTMAQVFKNAGTIAGAAGCPAGYTPAAGDARLLRVYVTKSTGIEQLSPDLPLTAVPSALVAETLQGYSPSQLQNSISLQGTNIDPALGTGLAANDILKWDGSKWVKSTITGTVAGACAAGKVLSFDGTDFTCVVDAGGGGSVSSVNAAGGAITINSGTTAVGNDINVATAGTTVTVNVPDASATVRGAMTTGAQTFAGAKTFNSAVTAVAGLQTNAQSLLKLGDADSSNFVSLRAPAAVGTDFTLTFPAAVPGGAGQALVSDTSGNLSWSSSFISSETDPEVGANTTNYLSKWNGTALVTSGVYESGGSVGIGTAGPSTPLHVVGTSTFDGTITRTAAAVTLIDFKRSSDSLASYTLSQDGSGTITMRVGTNSGTIYSGNGDLSVNAGTNGSYLNLQAGGNNYMRVSNHNQVAATVGSVEINNVGGTHPILIAKDAGAEVFRIHNDGKIAIGNSAPTEILHVTGVPTTLGDRRTLMRIEDSTAMGAGVGGGILFGGKYTAGGTYTGFSSIQGVKENATDGDYAGALSFITYPNAGAYTERMRISSDGGLQFPTLGTSPDISKAAGKGSIYFNGTKFQISENNGAWSDLTGANSEVDPEVGANTTNYLPKWNGTALVTSGVFENGGNVGIGTASPNRVLHIKSPSANANRQMLFLEEATATYGWSMNIDDATTGKLYLKKVIAGAESDVATFTNTGNVGIGTTGPDHKLDVLGATLPLALRYTAAAGGGGNFLDFYSSTTVQQGQFWSANDGTTALALQGMNALQLRAGAGVGVVGVHVKSDGNVGIGTTGPAITLHVSNPDATAGDLEAARFEAPNATAATEMQYITVGTRTTNEGAYLGYVGNDGRIAIGKHGAAEVISIKGGLVGIGSTTINGGAKLQVNGGIWANAGETDTPFTGNPASNIALAGPGAYWAFRSSTNHAFNIDTYNSGTEITPLTILQAGNVGVGTTAPTDKMSVIGQLSVDNIDGGARGCFRYTGTVLEFSNNCENGTPTWSAISGLGSESDPEVGANTTNYLSKWNGSALVTSGVYESGGSVGIGTASLSAKLHAVSTDATSLGYFQNTSNNYATVTIRNNGTAGTGYAAKLDLTNATGDTAQIGLFDVGAGTGWYSAPRTLVIGAPANVPIKINTNGVDNNGIYIKTDGMVGIGTTGPTANLQVVNATDGSDTALRLTTSDGAMVAGQEVRLDFSQSGTNLARIAETYFAPDAGFNFYTYNGGLNASPSFTIRGTGNVGIGTLNPAYKFHVLGAGNLTRLERNDNSIDSKPALHLMRTRADGTDPLGDFGVSLTFALEGKTEGTAAFAGSINTIWEGDQTDDTTARDTAMIFSTTLNNTAQERMRIDSNGGVSIPSLATCQSVTTDAAGKITCVPKVRFKVHKTAAQTLTTAVWATIQFNDESSAGYYDFGAAYDNATNYRFTAPAAGTYILGANICFAPNATGERLIGLWLNGTTWLSLQGAPSGGSGSYSSCLSMQTTAELSTNDTVELRAFQASGGNLDVSPTGLGDIPNFYGYRQY